MASNIDLAQKSGWIGDREEWFNFIATMYVRKHYASMTVETFLCHTDLVEAFCDEIRTKANLKGLSDFCILNTLLNLRKSRRLDWVARDVL